MPLLGIEAEVAFRLDQDIAADDRSWTAERFDAAVTALPAIEIVATRFASYAETPLIHRASDFLSNGALVCGTGVDAWRSFDLERLPVKLDFSGRRAADAVGEHAAGDPRLPAIAFLKSPLRRNTLGRGTIVTTGTYTGLLFAKPGDAVVADLGPMGAVEVAISA